MSGAARDEPARPVSLTEDDLRWLVGISMSQTVYVQDTDRERITRIEREWDALRASEGGETWCANEGCDQVPTWTDPETGEEVCARHVDYGCESTPHVHQLPSGQTISLALWLRVRASLLAQMEKDFHVTGGALRGATDAACEGFVAHSFDPGFREPYAAWYARQVIASLREQQVSS